MIWQEVEQLIYSSIATDATARLNPKHSMPTLIIKLFAST